MLVVAADKDAFVAAHGNLPNLVGGWTGQLSNSGETVELVNASGSLVDRVQYASEGDWATRTLGPSDHGWRGWIWTAGHDGGGKSLELIDASMSNDYGQNWTSSHVDGGTPGSVNSVDAPHLAPIITQVAHAPLLPHSNEMVTVTAVIMADSSEIPSAEVYWRANATGSFSTVTMFDDGVHGDGAAGDGQFGATLPAQSNLTVVEFYVRSEDTGGRNRTWPAPTTQGQTANALYLVDDAYDPNQAWQPGSPAIYHVIMTPADRAEFDSPGPGDARRQSDAEFNATFLALTPSESVLRYGTSVRFRGSGSRNDQIPNNRIDFPGDQAWQGHTTINLNQRSPTDQIVGSALFRLAGLPAVDAHAVRLLGNGIDRKNGGIYVHAEMMDSDFADNHFPTDSHGNVYRGRRPDESPPGGEGAGLAYFGEDPAPYVSYVKNTNASQADWSDVMALTRALNLASDAEFVQAVESVADVDQWFRAFAMNQLLDNQENGLFTGDPLGDDYGLYRGLNQSQFVMIPYDQDSLFNRIDSSIFAPAGNPALDRLINFPEFLPRYYAQFLDLIDHVMLSDAANQAIDESLRDVTSAAEISSIKSFIAARAAYVRDRINTVLTVTSGLTLQGGVPRSTAASIVLSGAYPQAETLAIRVGDQLATLNSQQGTWRYSSAAQNPADGFELTPGMNRLRVTTYDNPTGSGEPLHTTFYDVWYDDGSDVSVNGPLTGAINWTAEQGPYRVSGNVVVASGSTLEIGPGTTVFFDQGATLTINGQLTALGSELAPVWFTRRPGATSWNGLQFMNTSAENRLDHVILEYGITDNGMVGLTNANLAVENSLFDHTDRRRIRSQDSSLTVLNSTFATLFAPGESPSTNNLSEHIWGGGIPAGGQWVIRGNTFGTLTGHNDAIDFDAPRGTGQFAQILDNEFLGGGDDALDMTGDIYIEGNRFHNFTKDEFNTDPGNSNAISASSGDFWVIRNVFDRVQHASLVKETTFMYFLNNTVVSSEFAPLYFDLPGQTSGPGKGALVQGSIFADTATTFEEVLPTTDLQVSYSYLPEGDADRVSGIGNVFGDPHVAGAAGDFALLPGSLAKGHGPKGGDMGALIGPGVTLAGFSQLTTNATVATISVGGPGYLQYRYQLDNGPLSPPLPIDQAIQLDNLASGQHQVSVSGQNALGLWQAVPTLSPSWTVIPDLVSTVRINEVLANNVAALTLNGQFTDVVELYNAGAAPVDLSGHGISDDAGSPHRFVFPAGTVLPPDGYLLLAADSNFGVPGMHLGFGLDQQGDEVYLFSPTNQLLDSVEFGHQLADRSIGRTGIDGAWTLTLPTLGAANVAQPLGDAYQARINEWYADGRIRLPQDFVELYNPDMNPIDVSGFALSDKPFAIPQMAPMAPLSFIEGEGFFVLIADGRPQDGKNHLELRLDATHEHLGLMDASGQFVDQIFYYPQTSEYSQGRQPDGARDLAFSDLPTPGASNGGEISESTVLLSINWDSDWKYNASGQDLGTAWRESTFNDASWASGAGLLGHEDGALPQLLRTSFPIGDTTYYFRKTVSFDSIPDNLMTVFSSIVDDGFVLYVNGTEIQRRGMPGGTVTASTLANRTVGQASQEGPFTVPNSAWRVGENVIAVEVHQANRSSSDVVFGLQLTSSATVVTPVDEMPERLLHGLRITELMYHPSRPELPEYLELQNTSDQVLDLSGVRLAGGIDFTFPRGTTLLADEYIVVTEDTAAFVNAYGATPRLAGQFTGQLNNGGEQLVLQFAAPLETAILRFDYGASWYPATDGGGFSLAIADPRADYRHWGDAASWIAATPSPGRATGAPCRAISTPMGLSMPSISIFCAPEYTRIRHSWI